MELPERVVRRGKKIRVLFPRGDTKAGDPRPCRVERIERPDVNGENHHALEMLTYTHRDKVDAIYIDPPTLAPGTTWGETKLWN